MANRRTRSGARVSALSSSQNRAALVWVKRSTSLYGQLSTNVLREVYQYLTFRPLLAMCSETEVIVFDALKEEFRRTNLHKSGVVADYYVLPGCVCVDDQAVLLCGGMLSDCSKETIAADTWVVTAGRAVLKRQLKTPRFRHGLYYSEVHQLVFAFGGITKTQGFSKDCEQYDMHDNCWSQLPYMKERKRQISTCGNKGRVYLYGNYAAHIEMFTIASRQFALLSIEVVPMGCFASLAVWNSQLLLFQDANVQKWDVNSFSLIEELRLLKRIWSLHVVVKDVLFHLDTEMNVDKLNLRTMRIE